MYRSFVDWAKAEIGMTKRAYSYVKVVIEFSREQVERHGVSKLEHVLRAPAARRDHFLGLVEAGWSKHEIYAELARDRGLERPVSSDAVEFCLLVLNSVERDGGDIDSVRAAIAKLSEGRCFRSSFHPGGKT